MRFFALQYGPNCEVLEPRELRELVKADIIEMVREYEV
ncbi:MAG: WYL domain-containing protein [Bacillota bacterium]